MQTTPKAVRCTEMNLPESSLFGCKNPTESSRSFRCFLWDLLLDNKTGHACRCALNSCRVQFSRKVLLRRSRGNNSFFARYSLVRSGSPLQKTTYYHLLSCLSGGFCLALRITQLLTDCKEIVSFDKKPSPLPTSAPAFQTAFLGLQGPFFQCATHRSERCLAS